MTTLAVRFKFKDEVVAGKVTDLSGLAFVWPKFTLLTVTHETEVNKR